MRIFAGLAVLATATATEIKSTFALKAATAFSESNVDGPSPVQRVTALLNEMKTQLEADAAADEKVYEQMVCWCKTNKKEKDAAVKAADAKISELQAEIETRAGNKGINISRCLIQGYYLKAWFLPHIGQNPRQIMI